MLTFDELSRYAADDENKLEIYCEIKLQDLEDTFRRKLELYPALRKLIKFRKGLEHVVGSQKDLFQTMEENAEIQSVDVDAGELERASPLPQFSELGQVLRNNLRSLLSDVLACEQLGRRLFSLVNSKLDFSTVGSTPLRLKEGFFLLPVAQTKQPTLAVYYYDRRVAPADDLKKRLFLEIEYVAEVNSLMPPEKLKEKILLERISDVPSLANPPVFSFAFVEDDVDRLEGVSTSSGGNEQMFPLEETLEEVVRRRLEYELRQLSDRHEQIKLQ